MDSLHEAHLERILENRRRRGVAANHLSRRGGSTGTQTEEWTAAAGMEKPARMKPDASPSLARSAPGYHSTAAAAGGGYESIPQTSPISGEARFSNPAENMEGSGEPCKREWLGSNGNGSKHVAGSSDNHPNSPRFGNININNSSISNNNNNKDNDSYSTGDRLWGTKRSNRGWPSLRNSTLFVDAVSSSRFRNSNIFYFHTKSPRPTVPLLTYGSPRGTHDTMYGGSSRLFRYSNGSPAGDMSQGRSQNSNNHRGRYWGNRSDTFHDKSPNHCVNSPVDVNSMPAPEARSSRVSEYPRGFSDDYNKEAAGSVIYMGSAMKSDGDGLDYDSNEKNASSSLQQRQPPGPLPPEGTSSSVPERSGLMGLTNDLPGLPGNRVTLDIRTCVSILASGDWFYKWNSKGSSVSPRWVWVDVQSHLLLWAHKETHGIAFAGVIKLEKILQVVFRELHQSNVDGVSQTYYVLLVETTNRVLQLATERGAKADTWYEALNNVISYLKSHKFASPSTC